MTESLHSPIAQSEAYSSESSSEKLTAGREPPNHEQHDCEAHSTHSITAKDEVAPEPLEQPRSNSVDIIEAEALDDIAYGDQPSLFTIRTTIVDLVSVTATSSAFPESFGLSVSPLGRYIVAFSSRALYVVPAETNFGELEHCHAYKLRRKPLTVAISDNGHFAVLWNSFQVEVYKVEQIPPTAANSSIEKIRSTRLNIDARSLTLSHSGELLAAGSSQGVEIIGLTLPEGSDRRQIQCSATDTILFSRDQKSLLATGSAQRSSKTILLSVSIGFEQAMLMEDEDESLQLPIGKLWVSQLIFPEQLDARQCAFFPDPKNGQACELLAFNKEGGSFGIFDTVLKNYTRKTLTAPESVTLSGSDRYADCLIAVTSDSTRGAVAVHMGEQVEIWVYEFSEAFREEEEQDLHLQPSLRIKVVAQEDESPTFVSSLRWLEGNNHDALTLIALTHSPPRAMPEDILSEAAAAVSGRFILFDLSRVPSSTSERRMLIVNLDDHPLTEALADEQVEIEQEVDIVRRRTQVQRARQPRHQQAERQDSPSAPVPRLRRSTSISDQDSPSGVRLNGHLPSSRLTRRRSLSNVTTSGGTDEAIAELGVDEPYTQGGPRPQFMLSRAATVAQHAPSTRTSLRADPTRVLEYRRADGLREIPHESDADNWVPPPPPYSATPDNAVSLPINTIPGLAERVLQGTHVTQTPQQPANGMRSRVSQVMSGFQLPAFLPPARPVAQHHYADPARAPGPPPNVSIGSRSVRLSSSSATSTTSRLSRHSSLYTPRPLTSAGQAPINRPRAQPPPMPNRSVPPVPAVHLPTSSAMPQLTINTALPSTRPATALPMIPSAPSSTNSPIPSAHSPNTAISPARPSQSLSTRAHTFSSHTTTPTSPLNITPISNTARIDLDRPLPSLPSEEPPARSRFLRSSRSQDPLRPSTSRADSSPHGRGWRSGRTPQTARPIPAPSTITRQTTSNSEQHEKKEKCLMM